MARAKLERQPLDNKRVRARTLLEPSPHRHYSARMASDSPNPSPSRSNLWAPWRMEYITALSGPPGKCFLCAYRDDTDHDVANLVVLRRERVLVVMNRFPYTGGHLLIAPYEHVGDLSAMDDETMTQIMHALRDCQNLLEATLNPDGFNAGFNFGKCAGAGLPGHLHLHLVPRWEGDTNFMAVLGDVRVIPQSLDSLYAELRRQAEAMGLAGL